MTDEKRTQRLKPAPSVIVKVKEGQAHKIITRFNDTFQIGRDEDNDLQIKDFRVSRSHVRISFDGERWWVKDLESTNGTYLKGARIQNVPLPEKAELELGKGGPVLQLMIEREEVNEIEEEKEVSKREGFSSVTHIVQHYFNRSKLGKVGEQTMMFRRAVDRIHRERSKKYLIAIGISLILLLASGSIILYQKKKLSHLRNTAIDIFYSMKYLELQIAQLEDLFQLKAEKNLLRDLLEKRKQLKEMEKTYDNFVKDLGLYKKMGEEERLIFQIARLFGECEVNVPPGFVKEVLNYIGKWKSTGRLKEAIHRANLNNYTPSITKAMMDNNLAPHFFYLALKESGFEARAVGPKTKYGYAKGIWQFIPITAKSYGLQIGPLYKEAVYDPQDERFMFEKATQAAAKYLKSINNTEAQASGLLVMAAYNWGETKIREMIRQMPENPRERNFWCLLQKENIPSETYDYVFYIFSAAVICENPRLFGFDFDNPLS